MTQFQDPIPLRPLRAKYSRVETRAQRLRSTIEKIRGSLELSKEELLDILELTEKEYTQVVAFKKDLPLLSAHAFAERFDLSLDRLMRGEVDLGALTKRFRQGDVEALPERYANVAFSRRRTSINILDYVRDTFGWQARAQILRYFQMNEAHFVDPDKTVNFQFITDLCEYLKTKKDSDDEMFMQMGAYSVISNGNSNLARLYSKMNGPKELYETVFTLLIQSYYDKNVDYRLVQLSDTSCGVIAYPNQEVQEGLRKINIGSREVCLSRIGSFSCLTGYLQLPFAHVRKSKCIHSGDSYCYYYIDFELPAQLYASRH